MSCEGGNEENGAPPSAVVFAPLAPGIRFFSAAGDKHVEWACVYTVPLQPLDEPAGVAGATRSTVCGTPIADSYRP